MMNIFKNITILIALAAFCLLDARGKTETTQRQPQTTQRRYEEDESKQKQSAPTFKSLAEWVKTSPVLWNSQKNDFNTQALNSLYLQAQEANLGPEQLSILLSIAIAHYAQFPSENVDAAIDNIIKRGDSAVAAYSSFFNNNQ